MYFCVLDDFLFFFFPDLCDRRAKGTRSRAPPSRSLRTVRSLEASAPTSSRDHSIGGCSHMWIVVNLSQIIVNTEHVALREAFISGDTTSSVGLTRGENLGTRETGEKGGGKRREPRGRIATLPSEGTRARLVPSEITDPFFPASYPYERVNSQKFCASSRYSSFSRFCAFRLPLYVHCHCCSSFVLSHTAQLFLPAID